MTSNSQPGAATPRSGGAIRRFAARRPILTFLIITVIPTWTIQVLLLLNGQDLTPGLLAELVLLLSGAILVTYWADGGAGVRRLLSGLIRWRIGLGRYLLVLAALPALTVVVAAITGSLQSPAGGWAALIGSYLFKTVVFGALLANLWEETAWTGLVQSRLMARHGLLIGSVLTAVPFALIHLPLIYQENGLAGTTASQAALNLALLLGLAPVYRYLVGMVFTDTAGSILAVGLLHASWNASGSLPAVDGEVPSLVATVILTLLLAGYRLLRRSSTSADTRPGRAGGSTRAQK